MIHKASDLSSEQRMALESLLGRALSDREAVSVRAFEPPSLSGEERQELLAGLDAWFARIDTKRQAVSDEEAEAIINEALRSTRADYRPVREQSAQVAASAGCTTSMPA